ncbi:MAG: HEAT repeat domain-containing protein [Planctomycetes bacterium]|nr:HEAT repeat domain-containing protein [Planctomycetota bacterium]
MSKSQALLATLNQAVRPAVLFFPALLLAVAALRQAGPHAIMLWMGVAFQIGVCFLYLITQNNRPESTALAALALYLIALAWLWFGIAEEDWFAHLAKAFLLVVSLLVFALQTLADSGAPAIRRARLLADRLACRKDWPTDLATCRTLPEVKALRGALALDATPALALLTHQRPEVRVAALSALEFRKEWRSGQVELVLQAAQRAEQPAIRVAAVLALGNVEDRNHIETVALFLHDTSWEVRRAAIEALLWDNERRWNWIRFAVRRILADPLFLTDGPLNHDGQMLCADAVKDLIGWCAEKGALSTRAALTLGVHYNRALSEQTDESLVLDLRKQLTNPQTPACLRLELGRVLQFHQELDRQALENLLEPSNPAPLRLIAAEAIFLERLDGPCKANAMATLRDLARLPNREIALTTADIIQRRLGVDLGLGLGQPLPPIHSRQAAEITRRAMAWATQYDTPDDQLDDSRPVPQRISG